MKTRVAVFLAVLSFSFTNVNANLDINRGRGFTPDTPFQLHEIDNINLFNGNLVLTIPIGQKYPIGPNLTHGLTLTYNSNLWEHRYGPGTGYSGSRTYPNKLFNAGLGWQLSLGKFYFCTPYNPNITDTGELNMTYVGTDGSAHKFFDSLHQGDTPHGTYNGNTCSASGTFYTRDGSYLRLRSITGGTWSIEFPDGETHYFDFGGRLTRIIDRFGNQLTIKYCDTPVDSVGQCTLAPYNQNALEWVIDDSQGRRSIVRFRDNVFFGAKSIIDWIDLPTFAGTTGRYRFVYEENTSTAYFCPFYSTDPADYTLKAPFLTAVIPPVGNPYRMALSDYNVIPPPAPDEFGRSCAEYSGLLRAITLPTLGRIEWDYEHMNYAVIPEPGSNCPFTSRVISVNKRRLRNSNGSLHGEWNYTRHYSLNSECGESGDGKLTLELTDPEGNRAKHYFWFRPNSGTDGKFFGLQVDLENPLYNSGGELVGYLSSEFLDRDGALQRRTYQNYESEGNLFDPMNGHRRVSFERTEYVTDDLYGSGNATYTDTYYSDFDGLGHYRNVRTEGNFNLASHNEVGNVRKTRTEYNPTFSYPGFTPWPLANPWILNTYARAEVIEKDENGIEQKQASEYCFEKQTGFLGWSRTLHNEAQQSTTDVLTRNVRTAQSKGFATTTERYGGDVGGATVAVRNDACSIAGLATPQYKMNHTYQYGVLATSQYQGASFKSVERTIDASTGVVSSEKGVDGYLTTNYVYDALGRVKEIQPSRHSWTKISYINALANPVVTPRVDVLSLQNGSPTGGPVLAETRYVYDSFGRHWRSRRRIPGFSGLSSKDVELNALGQTISTKTEVVSETPGKTNYTFDSFGRPIAVVPPDGSAHTTTVSYKGVREIKTSEMVGTSRDTAGNIVETTSTSTEIYDQHGRLWKVIDPNGTVTRYTYDVGNRLTKVRITSGSITQTRTFTYDDRGFLLSETHPEKDASVTYLSYDSGGKFGRKIDGSSDLLFIYDSFERLTQVKHKTTNRLLKEFIYGAGNDITNQNFKNGKLIGSVRHNYNTDGGSALSITVYDYFNYVGGEGDMSDHTVAVHVNDAPTAYFGPTQWSYNQLGDVEGMQYPQHSLQKVKEYVGQSFADGFLTSINDGSNTLLSLTYHSNGLANQLTHENGVVSVNERDPFGRTIPYRIRTESAITNWDSGIYSYDGAGNTVKTGGSWFTYDKLSRLKEGRVRLGTNGSGVEKYQQYTHDAFGNIQNIAGSAPHVTTTDSATNQLTAFNSLYDSAGNLTNFNGFTYEYDELHQLKRMTAGGEEWLYAYSANDERILAYKVGSNLYKWSARDRDGKILKEFTQDRTLGWSGFTTDRKYIYAGPELVMAEVGGQTNDRIHYHTDHLGTPRLITQGRKNPQTIPLGSMLSYHVYYPFGEEATNPYQDFERIKFTGQERDSNSFATIDDLDYMHARYYSPVVSRFTKTDPAMGALKEPQSWNRYAYVFGNPLSYADPTGMCAETAPSLGTGLNICVQIDPEAIACDIFETVTAEDPKPRLSANELAVIKGTQMAEPAVTAAGYGLYYMSSAVNPFGPMGRAATWVGLGLRGTVLKRGTWLVYVGKDKWGVVRYVGLTEKVGEIRWAQHLAATGTGKELLRYEIVRGGADLTWKGARAMEQSLINKYGLSNLLNINNSIASKFWGQFGITP